MLSLLYLAYEVVPLSYSPDLATSDFLFPKMKLKFEGEEFNGVVKIQKNLQQVGVLNDILKENFQTYFQ
jgi:hypothetical protein